MKIMKRITKTSSTSQTTEVDPEGSGKVGTVTYAKIQDANGVIESKDTSKGGGGIEFHPNSAVKPTPPPIHMEQQGWGPGLGQNLDPGDKFTFTMGHESYSPVPYNSYSVGPFSVVITIRKGEGLEDAYLRAYQFLAQVFQIDFEIKRKQFFQRLGESGEKD